METVQHKGWLLDLYAHPEDGVVLWLLSEDGARLRLHQPFRVTFYAAGRPEHLRNLWRYLRDQPVAVFLSRQERRDLFQDDPLTVLAVQVENAAEQPDLFRQVAKYFPALTYYDADIPLALRHAAVYATFN